MNLENESLLENINQKQTKPIDLRPRNNIWPGKLKEQKREYIKLKKESKQILCKLVCQGFKIVDVAKQLKIKYETAKTVIYHYRQEQKIRKMERTRLCTICQIRDNKIYKLRIISSTCDHINTIFHHTFSAPEESKNPVKYPTTRKLLLDEKLC